MTKQEKLNLASDSNTSIEILEKLANSKDGDVRANVAGNLSTPISVLEKLSDDSYGVRKGISSNPSSIYMDKSVKSRVIANINCTPKILEKLSKDESSSVKYNVASNKKTPINVLEKLSTDIDEYVRKEVAKNINCPLHILEKLSEDECVLVHNAVAYNPSTPLNILKILLEDKNEDVRYSASKHPKIVEEKKEIELGKAKIESIKNDSISFEEFERLAKSPNAEIRANVAMNENCPNSILQSLAFDIDCNVGILANNNKNYKDIPTFFDF